MPGLDTWINLASVAVATAAIIFGVLAERRSRQLSLRIAALSARPVLKVTTKSETDSVKVVLHNYGAGIAKITNAMFSTPAKSANNLVEILEVASPAWPTYQGFPDGDTCLAAGESFRLAELSIAFLRKELKNPNDARRVLEQFRKKLNDCRIELEYTDTMDFFDEKEVVNLSIDCRPYESAS